MKTQKISLSFSKYADAGFLAKANLIMAKMTGNPAFADPVPSLGTLEDFIDAYATALTAALKQGTDNVAQKNQARLALQNTLQELGRWVMFTANGNATSLTSSGFDLTKMPEPAHLGAAGSVTITNGISSGSMVVKIKRVSGARGYIHQLASTAPANDTVWTSITGSRSRNVFDELVPGQQYWARVIATGSNGQTASSPVASQFAQ